MCGITGFIHLGVSRNESLTRLEEMLSPIYHRGPDDSGTWIDEQSYIALGHRRLSILDRSSLGRQPMASACGRFVIVFNGEIYNHLELRSDLENSNYLPMGGWRGHSDTETLLACFGAWGIEKTLKSTVGMFALALWDKQSKTLSIARDRIGEKPLYYGWQNDTFMFGSELKSLRPHPSFKGELNWHAANTFLHLNYIPAPFSIYTGILKLPPGTFIQITQKSIEQRALPTPTHYWSLNEVAIRGVHNQYTGSFLDAIDELEILLREAVKLQSVADVPVGAFLSGGIDSSTIVAMMQSATSSKVTTFSIGMPDPRMDESQHAAKVARHLGTNHVEHVIQPCEALNLIPRLSEIWDEPFADSSQISTYLVSQLAKQQVSVALSGDGGDEFFLGYPQYAFYQRLWGTRWLGKLPWRAAVGIFSPLARYQQIGNLLRQSNSLICAWNEPHGQALNRFWMDKYRNSRIPLAEQQGVEMPDFPILNDVASAAGLWDAGTYLPDDILVKVDRASMSQGLETRSPLLDHRVIEFSYRLPLEYKLQQGCGKKILREVLYRHVPIQLVNRPKMGFSIPLGGWLKKELRPWAEHQLRVIQNDLDFFDIKTIRNIWREHQGGQRDHTDRIWGLLTLAAFFP